MAGELLLWIILVFAIVGSVCILTGKFIRRDSWNYDQTYVWRRIIPHNMEEQEENNERGNGGPNRLTDEMNHQTDEPKRLTDEPNRQTDEPNRQIGESNQ